MNKQQSRTTIRDLRDAWPNAAQGGEGCAYCVGGALARGLLPWWQRWLTNYAKHLELCFPLIAELAEVLRRWNPQLTWYRASFYAEQIIDHNDEGRIPAAWLTAEEAFHWAPSGVESVESDADE